MRVIWAASDGYWAKTSVPEKIALGDLLCLGALPSGLALWLSAYCRFCSPLRVSQNVKSYEDVV